MVKMLKEDYKGKTFQFPFQFVRPNQRQNAYNLESTANSFIRFDIEKDSFVKHCDVLQTFVNKIQNELTKFKETGEEKSMENSDLCNFLTNLGEDVANLYQEVQENLFKFEPIEDEDLLCRRIFVLTVSPTRFWVEAFIVRIVEFKTFKRWTLAFISLQKDGEITFEDYVVYSGKFHSFFFNNHFFSIIILFNNHFFLDNSSSKNIELVPFMGYQFTTVQLAGKSLEYFLIDRIGNRYSRAIVDNNGSEDTEDESSEVESAEDNVLKDVVPHAYRNETLPSDLLVAPANSPVSTPTKRPLSFTTTNSKRRCVVKVVEEDGKEEEVLEFLNRVEEEAEEVEKKAEEADKKVKEAEKKVKEADKKVEEADKKVKEADKKVKEAEKKVEEADEEADKKVKEGEKKVKEAAFDEFCQYFSSKYKN